MSSIWWIRRDLRPLTDNSALHAALKADSVIPTFILDPAFPGSSPRRNVKGNPAFPIAEWDGNRALQANQILRERLEKEQ